MSLKPKRSLMCKLFCLISPSFRERIEALETNIVYLKIRANHSQRVHVALSTKTTGGE